MARFMDKRNRKATSKILLIAILLSTAFFQMSYSARATDREGPEAVRFTSGTASWDDIRYMETTNLDFNGKIYIHFNKAIKVDPAFVQLDAEGNPLPVLPSSCVKLYRIPKANPSNPLPPYESTGYYLHEYVQNSIKNQVILPVTVPPQAGANALENAEYLEELSVAEARLIEDINRQTTILSIAPAENLQNLNKYRVIIDNRALESSAGINAERPIEFAVWTKPSSAGIMPLWTGMDESLVQSITSASAANITVFDVINAPEYNSTTPIKLDINCEVIPAVTDDGLIQNMPSIVRRISFNALKGITLSQKYPDRDISLRPKISKFEFRYYIQDGAKKTKLCLYPDRELEAGREYELDIPQGTIKSRAGLSLNRLTVKLLTVPDPLKSSTILSVENSPLSILDLLSDASKRYFTIKGYNFKSNIEKIVLQPYSGKAVINDPVEIPREFLIFESPASIKVKLIDPTSHIIGDSPLEKLAKDSSTGQYNITVHFGDGTAAQSINQETARLDIRSKGAPQFLKGYPDSSGGSTWHDEKSILPRTIDGVTRYFLRATLRDNDGTLIFNNASGLSAIRDNCIVNALGSDESLIDADFLTGIMNMESAKRQSYIDSYLFNRSASLKEAYLYIPVKLLRPQTTYKVSISPEIVYFSDMTPSTGGNANFTWSFTTMSNPSISTISTGSVPENYDESTPIVITGEGFYSDTVRVFFNAAEAYRVAVKTGADGKKYLEAYLPRGASRLKPGVYNITVRNDSNHERVSYGSFSVVSAGRHIPNEDYSIRDRSSMGWVKSDLKVSLDTIELKSSLNNNSLVELDLDKLMGQDVLIRKVKINGAWGRSIGKLDVRSKWANIALYGLTVDYYSSDAEIELSLGRVEPVKAKALEQKLRGSAVKSDFIQVTGKNFRLTGLSLSIPIKNSSGRDLKVMRYDEGTRSWSNEWFSTNLVDMRAEILSANPGIFVVLE
ncbi:MAG: IPT/TIG domain-containing protein [Clostridia bacterium]|nr:IPT/TIG domain-containing protein [Clostridia bacterium]